MLNTVYNHHRQLSTQDCLPKNHFNYLLKMRNELNINPKTIYDIGSCVLHWTNKANEVWTDSKFYLFEAMESVEPLYIEKKYEYTIGVFSDKDNKDVIFYKNDMNPGGNSYYRENEKLSHFNNFDEQLRKTITIDTVVKSKNYKLPDLVKIDVQGCEVDILKGMTNTLKFCNDIIVELQFDNYNIGAMLSTDSIKVIESMGFKLVQPLFSNNGYDGDYHFQKL